MTGGGHRASSSPPLAGGSDFPDPVSAEVAELAVSVRPGLSRAVIYIIGLFASTALLWMWLGEVDVVASAPFRLVPLGQVRSLQAPRDGRVESINVREGESIAKGHLVVRLGSRETMLDLRALDRAESRLARARYRLEQALPREEALMRESCEDLEARLELMLRLDRAHRQALDAFREETTGGDRRDGETDLRSEIGFRTAETEHLRRRYADSRALYGKRLISRRQMDEARVRYLGALADLPNRMAKVNQFEASIRDLRRRILEVKLEREQAVQKARDEYEDARLAHEMARQVPDRDIEEASDLISTPEAGVITQVHVNTVGQVVSKGQALVTLAPSSAPLVAEVSIRDRDVGTVRPGMVVRMKYEAFPFADHGIRSGRLAEVSPDAVVDPAIGPVFRGTIHLSETSILVSGRPMRLRYGMRGLAEIVTDRQSVLSLILRPLRELDRSAEFRRARDRS